MRAILAMVVAVLALMMAPLAAMAQPASVDPAATAFTREIADRAAAEIGAANVRVIGPLRIVVVERNGAQSQMVLEQSYSVCLNRGAQACETAKTELVASIVSAHREESPEMSKARLRLLIRSSGYCAEMSRFYAKQGDVSFVEPLAPGLCVALMADFPTTVSGIAERDLGLLGIARAPAWRLGREQALADYPRFDRSFALEDGRARLEGRAISSLLLDTEAWDRVTLKYGELWVAVPSESLVLIRRAGSREDLADMRAEVQHEMEQAGRSVSPLIYRYAKGKWVFVE